MDRDLVFVEGLEVGNSDDINDVDFSVVNCGMVDIVVVAASGKDDEEDTDDAENDDVVVVEYTPTCSSQCIPVYVAGHSHS